MNGQERRVPSNGSISPGRAAAAKRMSAPGCVAARRPLVSGSDGQIAVKRAREPVGADDGIRVLVDRLWPRGLTKEEVTVDLWLKDAAPSAALRRWYGHDPNRWASFARKYRAELAERVDLLQLLDGLCRRGRVTLVFDASSVLRNNAVVLRDVLAERRRRAAPLQQGAEPCKQETS